MNSQNLRLAEVENFSGRQTFQVWHSEKLCLSGQWSRSLPKKHFLLSPLRVENLFSQDVEGVGVSSLA